MDDYKENEELGSEVIAPPMLTAKIMWLKNLDDEKLKAKLQSKIIQ